MDFCAKLVTCAKAAKTHGLPAKWLRSLLAEGHYRDIARLDVSKLQGVGGAVLEMLRGLEAFANLEGENSVVFAAEHYDTRDLMMAALNLYAQAKCVKPEDVKLAGLTQAHNRMEVLTEKITNSFNAAAQAAITHVAGCETFWGKYRHAFDDLAQLKQSFLNEAGAKAKAAEAAEAAGEENAWAKEVLATTTSALLSGR